MIGMDNKVKESVFQNDMIGHLLANGWLLGKPENYNRELALYPEDLLGFVQETQDAHWQKFCALYRGVAIFAKAFMGLPAQQAAKATRPLMPAAAPAVLLLSLDTQQGVSNIILAMTRRDFG